MKATIAVGSNTGNRIQAVDDAIHFLGSICEITRCSDIYESPDITGSGRRYMNAVLTAMYTEEIEKLKGLIKDYEFSQGRTSDVRERGEVPIDIDIVVWGESIERPADFNATYFKTGFSQIDNGDR